MKLLVLGGTMYLSKRVAALAVERGHAVTVAARGVSGDPPDGVRVVRIDRDDPTTYDALRGESYDAVVDVARIPSHVGPALAALAANAGHWTFISTCSVYADQSTPGQRAGSAPLLEPTPLDSADPSLEVYGESKVACEHLVQRHIGERAFVLRAGLIVGPGDPIDRFGYWPSRIAAGGEVLAPHAPEGSVQFIDVRDLATWILDGAEQGITGTYDAICPPITWGHFLSGIAAAVGTQPTFTWVDQDFLAAHGVNPWAGEESLGFWLPTPEYAGFLSRDVSPSLEAGLTPRPLAETVVDWMAAQDGPPTLAASLSREKEAEVLAAWHARTRQPTGAGAP